MSENNTTQQNAQQLEADYESTNGFPSTSKAEAAPAAQTFLASNSIYLSEIDLYFISTEANSDGTSCPVTVQVRNTDSTGEPGQVIYGETTDIPSQLNVGGQATAFTFEDPIFLEAGKSYAFLIYTAARNYQVAVSSNGRINYQDTDSSDNSNNPNGKVHGSFYYSMDGTDWTKGDPTGQLDASAGGLCLKFDLKQAIFNTYNQYQFEVDPKIYPYNDVNPQTPQYENRHQDGISYITFSPREFTPYNTSVAWQYSTNNGKSYNSLPINTTIPVNVSNSDIRIVATVNGSPAFTPLIDKGSLHLATERTICDSDNRSDPNNRNHVIDGNLQHYEFSAGKNNLDDRNNSGEYVSKVVTFGNSADSQNRVFNQINASFDELNSGDEPTSLYINLNPNNQPSSENSWTNNWIQLNGYDEYRQNGTDLLTALNNNQGKFDSSVVNAMQPSVDYLIVDPRTGLAYKPNSQGYASSDTTSLSTYTTHTYSKPIQYTYDGPWTTYHFHLSLKRLWNANKGNYHYPNVTNTNDVAHEIQFKIVFHADSPYDHPKVRRFLATVGKDDELYQQLSVN